ncbi:hypothetical protein EYF80_063321 [Liparis tanakae]|uniref:Uncharacterized protein n=1 Tax=Liparis tanakae TaxID=230148 RepID=A0A4Z2ECU2_9TELE|nr:hypothetical protein EYF80_063321 [Liparis tanakae]
MGIRGRSQMLTGKLLLTTSGKTRMPGLLFLNLSAL